VEWLEPWVPIADREWPEPKKAEYCKSWEAQLKREVGPQHLLYGEAAALIARRFDCDDALFQLSRSRVADVHLTWARGPEPDPVWPNTQVFNSVDDWATAVMRPAHAEWEP